MKSWDKGDGNLSENPPPPPSNTSTPRVLRLQCVNFAKTVLNRPLLRQCSLKIDSGNRKGVFKGCYLEACTVSPGGPFTRKIDFAYGLGVRFLSAGSLVNETSLPGQK